MRDEEIPEKDWQLKYPSYKSQVIHEKAARIYRMLIGSRADHLSWDNFNVDLVDFLPGGQFENQKAQKEQCVANWTKDLAAANARKSASKAEAMRVVAETSGLSASDLRLLLLHRDSMLAALKAGTIGTPIATTASVKKKVPFRVNLSARKAADSSPVSTPSTPTPGQAGVEAEKVVHRQLFLQSSPQTPGMTVGEQSVMDTSEYGVGSTPPIGPQEDDEELVPEPHIADAEVDMMDVVGDEPTQQAPIPKKRKRAEKEKTLPDPGPKRQRKEKEKPTPGTTKKRSLRSQKKKGQAESENDDEYQP
ncbi:hypothetical protein E4T46_09963 [Aureobasidium subglaciale]|nr:hypothetical protein E4T46_09963 [Aureobasidium subglaciale]